MTGLELIVDMRFRLRDDAKEGWSDEELKSSINFALSSIAHKLNPWKGVHASETIIGVDTYILPNNFMTPISVMIEGKSIPIKGIEWVMMHEAEVGACAYINGKMLVIVPAPISATAFHVNYNARVKISDLSEELTIEDEWIDTVLYYALSLALQKEASEQSLDQSRYYLSLYKDRCKEVAKVAHDRRSSRVVQSKFQKV